ncbi:hypothetical protein ABIQ69_12205 [Agromyces sp. G08B096]|uniref:Uncharacterized protein n=1 Tax=Agromyces sp. G08B096 TaxID=3156399 RepID=A0AAU7W6I5_9MICO
MLDSFTGWHAMIVLAVVALPVVAVIVLVQLVRVIVRRRDTVTPDQLPRD